MTFSFPDAVLEICKILKSSGYQSFLVGGCVRDQVMGVMPHDYDITTNCIPENVMSLFRSSGYRVVPTGLKYGTVTVIDEEVGYEVTTYRSESGYKDGRHPDEVSFLPDLRGDLERRDFTLNAMAYDPLEDVFVDYFDGVKDIERKVICAVGDPFRRFAEDHLRMFRAVRYASRFGYSIDLKTLEALKSMASGMSGISKERILGEIIRMADQPGSVFACAVGILEESDLIQYVFPDIKSVIRLERQAVVVQYIRDVLCQNKEADFVINLTILFFIAAGLSEYCVEEGGSNAAGISWITSTASCLGMSKALKGALLFSARNYFSFKKSELLSDYQLLCLLDSQHWQAMYVMMSSETAAVGSVKEKYFKDGFDCRISDLNERYLKNNQLCQIRKLINGQFIMNLKRIGSGSDIGVFVEKTMAWMVNHSVSVNDKDRIVEFVLGL